MTDQPRAPYARIISADSHLMEPPDLWARALGDTFGERTPKPLDEYRGEKGRFFNMVYRVYRLKDSPVETNAKAALASRAGNDPVARVEFQREARIDAEVLHATTMSHIMHAEDAPVVQASAAVFNDWAAEFSSHDPRRLVGIGMVPMFDIGWATAELQRIRRRGLKGAAIPLMVPANYPPYRDPAYDVFWAAAQDLDMPITLHAITGRVPDPIHFEPADLGKFPGIYIDLMFEIMPILANEFIFGGILDRFERLRIILGEFEVSWIPLYMFRLARIQAIAKMRGMAPLKHDAVEYMKTRTWSGMVNDPHTAMVRDTVGVDRIMWGSDYPHGRSIGTEAQLVLPKILEGIPPPEQQQIVADNVARVYGL